MPRDIDDILDFRRDLSPFLVHLTRSGFKAHEPPEEGGGQSTEDNLRRILESGELHPGRLPPCKPVSAAKYGRYTLDMDPEDKRRFFHAVCFSETPLNQVHTLLDIEGRDVDLRRYGLVFVKEELVDKGVAPVWYISNVNGDKDRVIRALAELSESDPAAAEKILPLVDVFGQKLRPVGAGAQEGEVDFRWEREWRLPAAEAPLVFEDDDVFVGLCPDEEIDAFEADFDPLPFIDPTRPNEYYARKLTNRRRELEMTASVVP